MPGTLQVYLAIATQKAAADLVSALGRIPEDKRRWRPEDRGRSALDQLAECAVLNGYYADLLRTRQWPGGTTEGYLRDKAGAVQGDPQSLLTLFRDNTARAEAAIRAVPDDALADEVEVPWGRPPLAELVADPYWNMTYHLGQINYIASLLGTLG